MINVKKGTAHSLAQSDWTGDLSVTAITRIATPAITAGMIVSKTGTSNAVVKGLGAKTDLVGFAVNNTDEGDTIESQKMGAYALDGGSTVETDQVVESVTVDNFHYGAPVYAYVGTVAPTSVGKVTADSAAGANLLIGTSEGVRTVFVGQTPVTLLSIKLTA